MATTLYLRDTTDNGITDTGDSVVNDMVTTAGASVVIGTCTATASGTEIQIPGPTTRAWISGRVPAGGFTLTSTDISAWFNESAMTVNAGGRYRLYRYEPGPTITELGGGPFDDGVEFGTSDAEFTWTGNNTDQAFNENDRILLRIFITNIGTMGSGSCQIKFNAADATTGDSFLNLAETVTFKAESTPVNSVWPSPLRPIFPNILRFASPRVRRSLKPSWAQFENGLYLPTRKTAWA